MNNKIWFAVAGICLLGMGIFGGTFIGKNPEVKEENIASVTGVPTQTPTTAIIQKGSISGYLIYPSEGIPQDVGVCAQSMDNSKFIYCVKQIRDKKYKSGVGYQMDLDVGNYYVYAFYKDMRAYYDEFVICGLKATCKSHAKIPVVVTAGSVSDNVLPHDWYDTEATVTVTPTTTVATATSTTVPTVASLVTAVPTIKVVVPIITIKIPQITIKVPTLTPTPIKLVIPTIKIALPKW